MSKTLCHSTGDLSDIRLLPSSRKSFTATRAAAHCITCINGPFFLWNTFKVCVPMKVNGQVIFSPPYSEWGLAWNDGENPVMDKWPTARANFVTNVVAVIDGKKRVNMSTHIDAHGTKLNPRYTSFTAYGLKGGKLVQYVSTSSISVWQLQDILYNAGWTFAIINDGGGSTMFHGPEGTVTSTRIIPYFMATWEWPKGTKKEMTGFGVVNVLSVKKHGSHYLTKNFKVSEFSQKGVDTVFIAPDLPPVLQTVREWAGAAVTITSGYRTDAHNKSVEGAEFSRHLYGYAADIKVKGKTPKQVYDFLCKTYPGKYGIGLYSTFVHIDVDTSAQRRW